MSDALVTTVKRLEDMDDSDIDFSDIPEITEEFLSHCTVRFPNVSTERLNGIRALLDRTGLDRITPDNLELAKKRWQEAEEEYDELCKAKEQATSSESLRDDVPCDIAAASS